MNNTNKTYSKPVDFDDFWDKSMQDKVENYTPEYRKVKADFYSDIAECSHLYFKSFDGQEIHALYLKPKKTTGNLNKALLLFHGYTWNSGGFAQKLQYVSMGYSVFAMDCRGQSGQSRDTSAAAGNSVFGHILRGIEGKPENLHYCKIFLDCVVLFKVAEGMEVEKKSFICALGDSQGGALALVCAALMPEVKKVIAYYPFLCDYPLALKSSGITAYDELCQYFKRYDPLHEKEDEILGKLAYIDIRFFTSRIKSEVLWIQGGKDELCPPNFQAKAYEKIRSPKNMLVYPEYGHEIMPDSHDRIYKFLCEL